MFDATMILKNILSINTKSSLLEIPCGLYTIIRQKIPAADYIHHMKMLHMI